MILQDDFGPTYFSRFLAAWRLGYHD